MHPVTDSHIHVVDPAFEMVPVRSYTPRPIVVHDVREMMSNCDVGRVVVIQMSVHGNDNSCVLNALGALGECARGVVHLSRDNSQATLERWHASGVRGARINLVSTSKNDVNDARVVLQRHGVVCAALGWHIQLFATPDAIAALENDIAAVPVPLVIDHFGLLPASPRNGEGERALMRLLQRPHVWLKLSAAYRLEGHQSRDAVASLMRDLARCAPDRVLWGSDWPHPPEHKGQATTNPPTRSYRAIATDALIQDFRRSLGDDALADRILRDNPAKFYRWAE